MKKLFVLLVASAVCLTVRVADAAIGLNSQQTFNVAPPVADWSTRTIAGGSGGANPVDAATLDAAVQTNTASLFTTALAAAAGNPPGAAGIAQWGSVNQRLITRPTGVGYEAILATCQNTSAGTLSSAIISYDLTVSLPVTEEVLGHLVYFSRTGDANSWTQIAGISGDNTTGAKLATLDLSANPLPPGGTLYILWADDNGSGTPDTALEIDNFLFSTAIACPTIDQQPSNTNSIVGRTVSLSVVASGPGLTYQWSKVGSGPIDTGANPSAATPTLVIANAQLSDTGDYYVSIDNPCPNPAVDSVNAHIEILPDTEPPRFLTAQIVGPGLNTFRLTTDEQLCSGQPSCVENSLFSFFWHILQADDLNVELALAGDAVMINPTTYEFTTSDPRDPSKAYRIYADDFGSVKDLSGNGVPPGTYAETLPQTSFQQGDANGYAGTQDAELHSVTTPDTALGAATVINVDNDDAGGVAHALLKFGGIFGSGPGQIPSGSTIISATLTLMQTDPGSDINLYRMLVDWDQATATWNSMVNGLSNDGVEATVAIVASKTGANANGPLNINVTSSVQDWAGGAPNYGWAFISTGTDGWRWNTSESGAGTAPLLTIEYQVNPCTGLPTITVQPPATVAINEGQTLSINVTLANACGSVQWTKDGTDIPGANSSTFTKANATPADNGSYRLRATNPGGSVTSDAAVVTVSPDLTAPTVVSASGGNTPTSVTITFSKAVSAATAENVANYSISPSLGVSSAVLSANGTTVTLTTDPRVAGTRYVVIIRNIRDTRSTPNLLAPNPTLVPLSYQIGTPLLAFTDAWKYEQSGTDLGTAWRAPGYDDSAWPSGPGVLGFETSAGTITFLQGIAPPNGTNTVLSLTNNAGATNPTIYFRTTFNNPYALGGISFTMRAYIDDGAVWFVNGTEAGRNNITTTPTLFNTLAGPAASTEAALVTTPLTGVSTGVNTLAVEVHQNALTSSDIDWGAEIIANIVGPGLRIVHNIDGSVTVSWDGPGSLQEATSLAGPWSNSASQTNPQTRTAAQVTSSGARFFRLQFTAP